MLPIFWQLIRTPPEKRDAAVLDAGRADAAKAWAVLDAHLAHRPYVCGAEPTIGDIPIGCYAHRWHALPIERPNLPHLAAWYARLQARAAYRKIVMIPLT